MPAGSLYRRFEKTDYFAGDLLKDAFLKLYYAILWQLYVKAGPHATSFTPSCLRSSRLCRLNVAKFAQFSCLSSTFYMQRLELYRKNRVKDVACGSALEFHSDLLFVAFGNISLGFGMRGSGEGS